MKRLVRPPLAVPLAMQTGPQKPSLSGPCTSHFISSDIHVYWTSVAYIDAQLAYVLRAGDGKA